MFSYKQTTESSWIIIATFAKENLPVLFQPNFIFDFDQENPLLCACFIFLIGKMIVKCQ